MLQMRDQLATVPLSLRDAQKLEQIQLTDFEVRTSFDKHPVIVGSKATQASPHTGFSEAKQILSTTKNTEVVRNWTQALFT
jgi:hypothetical protein